MILSKYLKIGDIVLHEGVEKEIEHIGTNGVNFVSWFEMGWFEDLEWPPTKLQGTQAGNKEINAGK